MAGRPGKLIGHAGPCAEEVWGSDDRYTRCPYCGTCRFYPEGYTAWKEKHLRPKKGVS